MCFVIARPGWVPEEASSAHPFGVYWIRFKEKLGCNIRGGINPDCLNAGLMKPRKGFTPVMGKTYWGWAGEKLCG